MLQPCVMAMNVTAEPAAMPVAHQEHAPCDTVLMEDCGSLADYSNDGRSSEPKPKNIAAVVAIISPCAVTGVIAATGPFLPQNLDGPLLSSGPSLNVRFCVYLK